MNFVILSCSLIGGINIGASEMVCESTATIVVPFISRQKYEFTILLFKYQKRYSEEMWIDQARNITGVNNHKYKLTSEYFSEKFRLATWHFDFPLMMPNSIGIFLLAEKAKEFFNQILITENANQDIAKEAQKRLNRDLSE